MLWLPEVTPLPVVTQLPGVTWLPGHRVTQCHTATGDHIATWVIWTLGVTGMSHWKFRLFQGHSTTCVLNEPHAVPSLSLYSFDVDRMFLEHRAGVRSI